jgi:WD40 repeat protein
VNTRTSIDHSPYLKGRGPTLAIANLDGQPVAIYDSADHSVSVVNLATHTIGKPYSGHTAPVLAVALGELDGRTMMISGGEDATLRVWDRTKERPMRRMLRAVCLRHSAPVLTAVTHQNQDHLCVLASCSDRTIWTWDLSGRHMLSKKRSSHGKVVTVIALLGSERAVFAAGGTLVVDSIGQNSIATLRIELESEILALTTYGPTTVVAATGLGIVVLDIPRP